MSSPQLSRMPRRYPNGTKGRGKEYFSDFLQKNVALILNPVTGNITPQYHVVFDEKFSTISTSIHNESASDVQLWSTLLDDSYDGNEVLDQPSTSSIISSP
jgi:hypothetical protein